MESKKKLAQLMTADVPDISCYCPGCFAAMANYAKDNNLNLHYAINRILWAFGDERPPKKKT